MVIQTNELFVVDNAEGDIVYHFIALDIEQDLIFRDPQDGIITRLGKKKPFIKSIAIIVFGFWADLLCCPSHQLVKQPIIQFLRLFETGNCIYHSLVVTRTHVAIKVLDILF